MNDNRRKFLKIIFVGSGAILMQKILGPIYSRFFSDSPAGNNLLGQTNLSSFKVVNRGREVSIFDSSGEEIFKIDSEV